MTQDELCCVTETFVEPEYPRVARLAHMEGEAKVLLVIHVDGSVADVQPVSGDPIFVDSVLHAMRLWHFTFGGYVGQPADIEVPVTFIFKIEDAPKPAYLHLKNGKAIRADNVREFTNGLQYSVGRHIHHISPESVERIDACAARKIIRPYTSDQCGSPGGPSFMVRALPLLEARN